MRPRVIYLDHNNLGFDGDAIARQSRPKKKMFVGRLFASLSPVSSLDERFFLARTPDRAWWVLWRGGYPEYEIPDHPVARVRTTGLMPVDAAITLVRKVWKQERDLYYLSRPDEIIGEGLLRKYQLERILDQVWPPESKGAIPVAEQRRATCECDYPGSGTTCRTCAAPTLFVRWVPFGDIAKRRIYRAIYHVEPNGPHRNLTDVLLQQLRTGCVPCRGSGIVGAPPEAPGNCPHCAGNGGGWWCAEEEVDAARAGLAQVYPDALDPSPPKLGGWLSCERTVL